ncbi:Reticulocyte-binding protein [Trichoderma ghanense]|uniref:Reticulocyte-binding protein n=1 Tax=Trichoderma ghanense TaxID=65468 RepID=A0ABY2HGV3_9HYPO
MSNHRTRPARSNSLQRMLELERRYMLERLQASASQANALSANSCSLTAVVSKPPLSSANRPAVQHAHRIEATPLKDAAMGATVSKTRETRPDTHIIPLTINVSSPMLKLDIAPESDKGAQRGAVVVHQPPAVDKPVLKAVSFDVPLSIDEEERRSICQSPSWEAYGRRKKSDKKDSKKEQKKEQLKKEQLKREEERKEQERRDQLKKEQLKKEQLKKEELKKEQLKKEQQRKEELKKEQLKKEQAEKELRKKEQQAKASKREKEESTLKNALIKKKRLSKQPPPSSSHAIEQANRISVEAAASSRDKQRPSSALEFTSPVKGDTPVRPSHRRSGSFTSLIRAPFESRRASSDTARPVETGFIGGIKLEIQRYAANQKAAEEPQSMDESQIHPALRTNNAHNQKWSAPAARPTPESQRRAYPPITRNAATAAKTRSLISSAEMEAQDTGTMEKWRAFVGLKPKDLAEPTKTAAQQEGSKKPAVPDEPSKSSTALPSPQANARIGTSDTRSPTAVTPSPLGSSPVDSSNQSAKPKLSVSTGDHQSSSSATALKPPKEKLSQANLAQLQQLEGSGPIKSKSPADRSLVNDAARTAESLPPAPPRRSSKRNSLLSLDDSVSSLSRSRSPAHRPSSSDSTTSIGDRIGGKPKRTANNTSSGTEVHSGGAPLQSPASREAGRITGNQKPDPIEVPTWEDIQSSVMQVIDAKVSLSPIRKSHSFLRDDSDFTVRRLTDDSVPTTSADDDSSDDFHSVSMPGTPDTSRPQSEKGVPPLSQDVEGNRAGTEQHRARNLSQSPVKQPLLLQIGGFSGSSSPPKVPSTKPATADRTQAAHHRTQSAVDSAPAADFLPKLKHQPLKAVESALVSKQHVPSAESLLPGDERANSKTQLVVAPWPASYLEEARKAAPLAPPPQVLGSPRLVPKGTPPASIRSQPSPTTDLTPTKGPRHTAGSPVGGEPIAKMFVECCGCKYYHDMPSNIYEAMANPEAVIRPRGNVGFTGALSMTVKCPWCSHEMSTKCCAGYAAMVYVKERLH